MGEVLHPCIKGTGISPVRTSSYPRSVGLPPFLVLVLLPGRLDHFGGTGRSADSCPAPSNTSHTPSPSSDRDTPNSAADPARSTIGIQMLSQGAALLCSIA